MDTVILLLGVCSIRFSLAWTPLFCGWESVHVDSRLHGHRCFVAGSLFSLILACMDAVTVAGSLLSLTLACMDAVFLLLGFWGVVRV